MALHRGSITNLGKKRANYFQQFERDAKFSFTTGTVEVVNPPGTHVTSYNEINQKLHERADVKTAAFGRKRADGTHEYYGRYPLAIPDSMNTPKDKNTKEMFSTENANSYARYSSYQIPDNGVDYIIAKMQEFPRARTRRHVQLIKPYSAPFASDISPLKSQANQLAYTQRNGEERNQSLRSKQTQQPRGVAAARGAPSNLAAPPPGRPKTNRYQPPPGQSRAPPAPPAAKMVPVVPRMPLEPRYEQRKPLRGHLPKLRSIPHR